ncbi:DegT/DnrJ/EryC1/StrS family aminotransferase [Conyzicola sp.]|uniref:DegT/DnrJ/EryC1/StrS family aminotransferase n=1 Tax=Conyzicola sp. TaxID=1969404 RepID=UPI003989E242
MTTTPRTVAMLDLAHQHRAVEARVAAGFARVLETGSYILGPAVDAFEAEYAAFSDVAHVVGVGNGTDAIELALRAAGIGRGDRVAIPANTFVATAEAVVRAGASVVLVDCDEHYLIDPDDLRRRLTPQVRAVIAVHLYGQMADVDAIRAVVGEGVVVIEDAAQSQGARHRGRRSGSLGDAAGTSFYPGKNLGAYGDAGAVSTGSARIAERVRALRNHGGTHKYEHLEIGTNSRLDSLQAVVLSAKLEHLDAWNAERRALADRYTGLLADLPGVITPTTAPHNEHVWHQYVVRVADRDQVLATLVAAGIGAGVHYPSPVHRLPAFDYLGGSFPHAEAYSRQLLSLPIYPGLDADAQDYVVETLAAAVAPRTATATAGSTATAALAGAES